MALVIVRHKVAEFADLEKSIRWARTGACRGWVFQCACYSSADNSSDVVVLQHTDDIGKAKQFIASPELKSAMSAAGVVDKPDVFVLIRADAPDLPKARPSG